MKSRLRKCLSVFLLSLAFLGYCVDVQCLLAGDLCQQTCPDESTDACSQPLVRLVSCKPALAVLGPLISHRPSQPAALVTWAGPAEPPTATSPNPRARQNCHRGPPA
ncbi:MAG: hypothetical protein AB7S38_12405 [Vulcanimicrobiota bacterium]